jgi:carbon starvation protein
VVVGLWAGFLYTGTIGTLWPLLGIANQLLATTALAVGTAVILRLQPDHRGRAWVTAGPMLLVGGTTLCAGWQSVFGIFLQLPNRTQGAIDAGCTLLLMLCTLVVGGALLRRVMRSHPPSPERSSADAGVAA